MIDAVMNSLRREANDKMIKEIKEGNIKLDDEVLPPFLAANLISNPQILDILEVMGGLVFGDTMEKEYVVFLLNKVKELANKERMF